ncbi:MAG TPA: hypothetical protein VK137_15095 [Planctomycetaceae bacterium]|nr:hypothetical protein [Planctomycetaceae bacterium]
MSRIIVKGEFRDTLTGVADCSELTDESGQLLGIFVPIKPPQLPLFGELSDEEIARRAAEPGGRSWAEIREDLEAGYFRVPSISDEEIQRRRQHTSERTLADIWAQLGVQR